MAGVAPGPTLDSDILTSVRSEVSRVPANFEPIQRIPAHSARAVQVTQITLSTPPSGLTLTTCHVVRAAMQVADSTRPADFGELRLGALVIGKQPGRLNE